jgi:hypothetical protein
VTDTDLIYVRTATGRKVHAGWPGSSTTICGCWLKTQGDRMRVSANRVRREHLCERCFSERFDHGAMIEREARERREKRDGIDTQRLRPACGGGVTDREPDY